MVIDLLIQLAHYSDFYSSFNRSDYSINLSIAPNYHHLEVVVHWYFGYQN